MSSEPTGPRLVRSLVLLLIAVGSFVAVVVLVQVITDLLRG